MQPEPCLKDRCRSPVACEGWGYCRERNAEIYVSETDDDGGKWWSADCLDGQYRTQSEAVEALRKHRE